MPFEFCSCSLREAIRRFVIVLFKGFLSIWYITLKQERNKPHLIFDKKSVGAEEKRLNLRMVLPDNYILEEQLILFREKIKEKYDLIL